MTIPSEPAKPKIRSEGLNTGGSDSDERLPPGRVCGSVPRTFWQYCQNVGARLPFAWNPPVCHDRGTSDFRSAPEDGDDRENGSSDHFDNLIPGRRRSGFPHPCRAESF